MKTLLAVLSGFLVMLITFIGGALSAVFLVSTEPPPAPSFDLDTAGLWTNKPEKVHAAQKDLERVPPPPSRTDTAQLPAPSSHAPVDEEFVVGIDKITTSATPEVDSLQPDLEDSPAADNAHVGWCSSRFRSYRAEDNTYTPYSGGRRECISPYSKPEGEIGGYMEAAFMPGGRSSDHVQSCFDRYRSYRPEDNTYQPYSGGPRRQCE